MFLIDEPWIHWESRLFVNGSVYLFRLKCFRNYYNLTFYILVRFCAKNMVEENRTDFGQVDIVDDDNMIRLPRQRIVDMYKNAMSRVRVLEAKANEGTIFSLRYAKCIQKNYILTFLFTYLIRKSDKQLIYILRLFIYYNTNLWFCCYSSLTAN